MDIYTLIPGPGYGRQQQQRWRVFSLRIIPCPLRRLGAATRRNLSKTNSLFSWPSIRNLLILGCGARLDRYADTRPLSGGQRAICSPITDNTSSKFQQLTADNISSISIHCINQDQYNPITHGPGCCNQSLYLIPHECFLVGD